MTDEPASWADLAELRQGVYRFFAAALLHPDAERLELLGAAARTLAGSGLDQLAFGSAWRAAADIFESPPPLEELEAGFEALFISAAGSGSCPPIESRYGAAPGRAPFVDAELRGEYASFGVAVKPDLLVPSDHISVQLEVMSSLCHDEAHAWSECRDRDAVVCLRAQWRFLDAHLLRWVPLWAAHVAGASADRSWTTVVAATHAFVQHDADLVTLLTRSSPVSA